MKSFKSASPMVLSVLFVVAALAARYCERQTNLAQAVTNHLVGQPAVVVEEPAAGQYEDVMVIVGKPFRPELPALPKPVLPAPTVAGKPGLMSAPAAAGTLSTGAGETPQSRIVDLPAAPEHSSRANRAARFAVQ